MSLRARLALFVVGTTVVLGLMVARTPSRTSLPASVDERAFLELYEKADRPREEGRFDEAVQAYDELLALAERSRELPADVKQRLAANLHFDRATSVAHLGPGRRVEAFVNLERAFELGFFEWGRVETSPDLAPLRADAGWKKALERGHEAERRHAQHVRDRTLARLATEKPLRDLDLDVTTLDGRRVTLESRRGKVVIVDFWGTWCLPCVAMLPSFVKLDALYRERGLEIVALAAEDGRPDDVKARLQAFAKKHGLAYTIAAIDRDHAAVRSAAVEHFPTTLWLDREGKVRVRHEGLVYFGELDGITQAVLETPRVEGSPGPR